MTSAEIWIPLSIGIGLFFAAYAYRNYLISKYAYDIFNKTDLIIVGTVLLVIVVISLFAADSNMTKSQKTLVNIAINISFLIGVCLLTYRNIKSTNVFYGILATVIQVVLSVFLVFWVIFKFLYKLAKEAIENVQKSL